MASQNNNAKGFHAIEYLLWGIDGNKVATDLTAREIKYIQAATQDLKNNTQILYNGWIPSSGNYSKQFLSLPSTNYASQKNVLQEITDGIFKKTKRRFNWLLLNLVTAIIASIVIGFFQEDIEKVVALAVLMPIVASMGGNAGMQTLAVTIRTIATNELTKNNFAQNVIKEFSIGILNGFIFALISAIVVQFWFNDYTLSLIISISMVLNMIVAGLFGILVPITLKKFNIDPAIASSVFVTTITDVIGFLSFLGIGAYFFFN